MTLASGREFLSIPGPTTVPDEVLSAMHRPAIDIYSGALVEVTTSCLADLRRVFRTEGRVYIYAANGHGAWEAALVNVLSKGDTVLVLESGLFAAVWGDMARVLGLEVEILPGNSRRAVDPAALETYLRADRTGRIKAVLVVQVDTASSAVNDIPAIRQAMDAAGHDALLMVDAIASLATMPFDMDAWRVDVAVAGSQKGLMTPPGLSFVAAGCNALAAHRSAGLRTRYWDWTERDGEQHYQKYCGTPPEHLLFGLRKALDLLFAEGLENVFRRHRLLAEAVRRAVADLGRGRRPQLQHHRACRTRQFRDHRADRRRARSQGAPGLLRAAVRRGAGHGDRPAQRQGSAHRAHGAPQRADDPRHAWRAGDRPDRARRRPWPGRGPGGDRHAR